MPFSFPDEAIVAGFIVRDANPSLHDTVNNGTYAHPVVLGGSYRHKFRLVDGQELDELLYKAFDCDDSADTFRGRLRAAVNGVRPDVLTSLCGWRMCGVGLDDIHVNTPEGAQLTLLVTVRHESTSTDEAIGMVEAVRGVLYGYHVRLGNEVAIEISESEIQLATTDNLGPASRDSIAISFQAVPGMGASVGPVGRMDRSGTLGPLIRLRTPQRIDDLFCHLTCSHVMSDTTAPRIPDRDPNAPIADKDRVDCPSPLDHYDAYSAAVRAKDTEAEKRIKSFPRALGSINAFSGITNGSARYGNWILDWATIKLDANRVGDFERLSNIPTEKVQKDFNTQNSTRLTDEEWAAVDWTRPSGHPFLSIAELRRINDAGETVPILKVGRTTGLTAGHLHRIDPSITIRLTLDGHEVCVTGKTLVTSRCLGANQFAYGGDSGSLVLTGHAQGVGTVIAKRDGLTFIAPLGPTLKRIEDVFGLQAEYV